MIKGIDNKDHQKYIIDLFDTYFNKEIKLNRYRFNKVLNIQSYIDSLRFNKTIYIEIYKKKVDKTIIAFGDVIKTDTYILDNILDLINQTIIYWKEVNRKRYTKPIR